MVFKVIKKHFRYWFKLIFFLSSLGFVSKTQENSVSRRIFLSTISHNFIIITTTTCERIVILLRPSLAVDGVYLFFTSPSQRNFNAKYRKTRKGGGKRKFGFAFVDRQSAQQLWICLSNLRRRNRFFDFRNQFRIKIWRWPKQETSLGRTFCHKTFQGISLVAGRLFDWSACYWFPNFHFCLFFLINMNILASFDWSI